MFQLFKAISYRQIRRYCETYSVSQLCAEKTTGKLVNVKGWVKTLRNMKDTIFLDVTDGSSLDKIQVTLPKHMRPKQLSPGASIHVVGLLGKSLRGEPEVNADSINVLGQCIVSEGYPFVARQAYHPDYVRQYLHLRPRTSQFASLLRIRDAASRVIHDYYKSNDFLSIHTPVLTSNDCEGAGEVFSVQPVNKTLLKSMAKDNQHSEEVYFNSRTFLTVSGQLHLEAAAHGLSKVYTFGPTFRAENSKSRLHLSEFYMLEAEIAFLDDFSLLLEHVENMVKTITKDLIERCPADIANVSMGNRSECTWLDQKFETIAYQDAVGLINKRYADSGGLKMGSPLTKEHEHYIVDHHNEKPTFVINWPKELKPFYMKVLPNDPDKVAAFDLLVPNVGELVGGSLREDNYEVLRSKIPQSSKQLKWYLDLRRFGGVSTGGYGMGFERFLQMLLQVSNIKDTIPFPRWPHNCAM